MSRKLLTIMPKSTNYGAFFEVSVARSFEEAREMIRQAEQAGNPFDDLEIPVTDENEYHRFLSWMRRTGRDYPFYVSDCRDSRRFWELCQEARALGFRFNT